MLHHRRRKPSEAHPEPDIKLCRHCFRTIWRDPTARRPRWIHNDTRSVWCRTGAGVEFAEPLDLPDKENS